MLSTCVLWESKPWPLIMLRFDNHMNIKLPFTDRSGGFPHRCADFVWENSVGMKKHLGLFIRTWVCLQIVTLQNYFVFKIFTKLSSNIIQYITVKHYFKMTLIWLVCPFMFLSIHFSNNLMYMCSESNTSTDRALWF